MIDCKTNNSWITRFFISSWNLSKSLVKANKNTFKEPCFGEFQAASGEFFRLFKKDSSFFGKKVSQIGKEWHLDIGIDQSWRYYELPSQTRENNSDQESLADFEGFRAAEKKILWPETNHRLRPRAGRTVREEFEKWTLCTLVAMI